MRGGISGPAATVSAGTGAGKETNIPYDDHEDDHGNQGEPLSASDLGQAGEDVEGLEMFTLRSVGIDIGSSTSHLVFSRLILRRQGSGLSARFDVTDRKVLHRSRIMLTPYVADGTLIDTERLAAFVQEAYQEAGVTPDEVDTGAVVITGEALKKENAKPIVELFARGSGRFICASAGPNHEALLAAYGSGAVALSRARQATVLNVDVGGGTSKLSLIRDGAVLQTAAVNVGARLLAFDDDGRLARVEQPARLLMRHLGQEVELGQRLDEGRKEAFAALMAHVLFEVVRGGPYSELTRELLITEPLTGAPGAEGITALVFSGGVSEYIYAHEATDYGDLGPLFARQIRAELDALPLRALVAEPAEGIRATVIGAGEYTIQVSGTTSYVSSRDALPAFGLQVIRPALEHEPSVESAVRRALARYDLDRYQSGLALAISLQQPPDYPSLRRLAEGIYAVVRETDDHHEPLFLILDMDVAKSLGGILKEELKLEREVVAVDGIDVGDLDYVDIGRPMGILEPLPVTVKSLLFPSEAH